MTRCILERMWCNNWHSIFETCELRNYSVQTLGQDPIVADRRLREWSGTQRQKKLGAGRNPGSIMAGRWCKTALFESMTSEKVEKTHAKGKGVPQEAGNSIFFGIVFRI